MRSTFLRIAENSFRKSIYFFLNKGKTSMTHSTSYATTSRTLVTFVVNAAYIVIIAAIAYAMAGGVR